MVFYTYPFPVGNLTIGEEEGALRCITAGEFPGTGRLEETELIKETRRQLEEYFEGKRKDFDLPLDMRGTLFQVKVWKALQAIPYGEVRTYKQIAEEIGHPKAVRAVGMANHVNPFIIVVPCHRVIGTDGKLTGYAAGLDKKSFLLRLEGLEKELPLRTL